MFYLLPLLISLSILLSLTPLIFVRVHAVNPSIITEEKPSIEHLQNNFAKIFKGDTLLSKSSSDIKILAIASGSVKMALISHGGEVKTIRVGSKIGNYEIKEIMRNYIIVSKGVDKKIISYSIRTASASTIDGQNFTKKEIERLTHDPGVLFQEIRLRPIVEEGKTKGFAFEWIKPGSIFEKAGIKPGDILLSINNIEIKSGEDAFRILQALRNEPSLKISLLREGQSLDINLMVD